MWKPSIKIRPIFFFSPNQPPTKDSNFLKICFSCGWPRASVRRGLLSFLFHSSAFFSACSVLAEKTRGHGFEADFPAVVVADLSGVCAWRPWRLSSGSPLLLVSSLSSFKMRWWCSLSPLLFHGGWELEDCSHIQSDAVDKVCGFTSVRWHLSPMHVASPSRVRLGRKCWVWATPAWALPGDGWWWCFSRGGFQRSTFGVYSLGLLRSVGSGVAPPFLALYVFFWLGFTGPEVVHLRLWFVPLKRWLWRCRIEAAIWLWRHCCICGRWFSRLL